MSVMLKRLYTLFIIIAMAASSTVKAEDTIYQLVKSSSVSVLEAGVYIFVDLRNNSLYTSSSYIESSKKFSDVKISGEEEVTEYPEDITISEVNKENSPYEYIIENVNGNVFRIKGADGKYLCNTRESSAVIGLVDENDLSNGGVEFTISRPDDENIKFLVKNTNKNKVTSCLAFYKSSLTSSTYYFACWKTDTPKYVSLYKKVSSTPNPPSPNTATFTMSNVGYATLYYGEKDVTLPVGLTANTYTLKNTQDATYLTPSHTYIAGDKIPAGTAVVVKGNEGNYTLTLSEIDNTLPKYDNVLEGCDVDTPLTSDASKYFYKLTLNSEGDPNSVGFYWAEEDGAAFTTLAHKAYLAIAKSAAAKSIVTFLDSDNQNTTGLVDIKANVKADAIYDLSGKHASKSGKGIKIEKGKKYLMR